ADPEVLGGGQVGAVEGAVDRERPAEAAGAVRAGDAVEPADQHGAGLTVALGDDVDAVVHAVGEVDVGVAGVAEHDGVARRAPALAAVRGGVVRVGLDLDDAAAQDLAVALAAEPA